MLLDRGRRDAVRWAGGRRDEGKPFRVQPLLREHVPQQLSTAFLPSGIFPDCDAPGTAFVYIRGALYRGGFPRPAESVNQVHLPRRPASHPNQITTSLSVRS
jgi:hypothetical protein